MKVSDKAHDAADQIAFTLNDLIEVTSEANYDRNEAELGQAKAALASLFRDACLQRNADMEADLFDELFLEFMENSQRDVRPLVVGRQPFRPGIQNQTKQKLGCETDKDPDERCKLPRGADTCCMDELECSTEQCCAVNTDPEGSQHPGMIDAIIKGMGPQLEKLAEARVQTLIKQHGLRRT